MPSLNLVPMSFTVQSIMCIATIAVLVIVIIAQPIAISRLQNLKKKPKASHLADQFLKIIYSSLHPMKSWKVLLVARQQVQSVVIALFCQSCHPKLVQRRVLRQVSGVLTRAVQIQMVPHLQLKMH